MTLNTRQSAGILLAGVVLVSFAAICRFHFIEEAKAADAPPAQAQGRAGKLIAMGLKFSGSDSCGGSNCHNQAAAKADGFMMTELTTWKDQDAHTKAMGVLTSVPKKLAKKYPELKTIGEKLGIANAAESTRCISCHGLNAPKNLQGDKFDLSEGVTCSSCHGPSEKWLADHSKKEWAKQQRDSRAAQAGDEEWKGQAAHSKLLGDLGLYDTKPLVARAEICVSCHLAIDTDLVDAGHPQPFFELNYFQETEPKHWRELPRDAGIGHMRVWAVGQVVSLREALNQLAVRAADKSTKPEALKEALAQALAHGAMVQAAIDAKAITAAGTPLADLSKLKEAWAGKPGDVAATAKSLAGSFKDLANAAMTMQPTPEMAASLAKSIAADAALAKDFGRIGAQQQGLAVWSLVRSTEPPTKEESDELKALADFKSPYRADKDQFDLAAYSAALKAAAPK
jgi:hypothetical protein